MVALPSRREQTEERCFKTSFLCFLAQKKKQTIQISLTENEKYGKLYIRKERKERAFCVLHVWRGEMIW